MTGPFRTAVVGQAPHLAHHSHHQFTQSPTPSTPRRKTMSHLTPDARRAEALYRSVMQTVTNHRAKFFSEPSAEGFCVYLSVTDARLLDEMARREGELFPQSNIRDGDTGTLMGLPFIADASVRPGRVYVGYRVDALEVQP